MDVPGRRCGVGPSEPLSGVKTEADSEAESLLDVKPPGASCFARRTGRTQNDEAFLSMLGLCLGVVEL